MPILDVRHIPQWGVGANRVRNDCGPASVAMCLDYYDKLDGLTVDALALETGLRYSDTGLMPADLVKLAARHNLSTYPCFDTTEADLRREIDVGRPVVLLFAYRFILGRLDQADNVPGQDGHFAVLVGYDDTHWVLNDPDVWQPYLERGHDMVIPVTELRRAMAEYRNQTVMMGERMSLSEQLTNLGKQIEALATDVAALEAAPPPVPPKPVEEPLPGAEEEKVIVGGVNVRLDNDAASQRLDGLIAGQRVVVQGSVQANGHIWSSVKKVNGVVKTYQVGDRTVYGRIARDVAFS